MQRNAIYQDGLHRAPEAARIVLIGREYHPNSRLPTSANLSRRWQKIVRAKEAHRYWQIKPVFSSAVAKKIVSFAP